jgi:hypothetical protein
MSRLRIVGLLIVALLVSGGVAAWSRPAAKLPFRWSTFRSGRKGYWSVRIIYPVFGGGSPLARTANAELATWARSQGERFDREMRELFRTQPRPHDPYPFNAAPAVALATPALISLYFHTDT